MKKEPIDIIQVLLLFDAKNSSEYGLALWAALNEVEALYNKGEKRMNGRRFYISPHIPTSGFADAMRSIAKFFTQSDVKTALDVLQQNERVQADLSSASMATKASPKTYDQRKLAAGTREKVLRDRLGAAAMATPMMIITDRPITPPSGWRYIFWETWPGKPPTDAVISTVPLDPGYWGDSDHPDRISVIKDRVRTSALAVCGEFLNLNDCHNPRCFLCERVDSVNNVDLMSRLGEEHASEVEDLVGLGFDRIVSDPDNVQQVKSLPRRGGTR